MILKNMLRNLVLLGAVSFTLILAAEGKEEEPSSLRELGQQANRERKFKEAISCADRLLARPDLDEYNRIEAHLIRGIALKNLNRKKEAVEEMNRILDRTYPKLPSSHQMAPVGNFIAGLEEISLQEKFLLFFERCPEKADYQKPLQRNWKNALNVQYLRKGTAALDAKRTSEAIETLQKALKLSATGNNYFYYGLACLQGKKYQEADRCAENLSALKKKRSSVILKSQALFGLGRKEEGRKLLRDYLESDEEEYIPPYQCGLMGDAAFFMKDPKSLELVIRRLRENPSIPAYLEQKIALWQKWMKP